jgi:FkbM family methyltransferase
VTGPASTPAVAVSAYGAVKERIRGPVTTVRAVRDGRVSPAALAARARLRLLERAPDGVLHAVAAGLARGRPLALDPAWRFRVPGDDEGQLTLLRREIWNHYRENGIDTPVLFRWYDRLRLRLYLGNDLSLCLYVLGAFEPNAFVFLNRFLEPGMIALDGGANEGLFTLYAARRIGSRGSVLAVEPSTREFERLTANIQLNRLDNVKTLNVALGSREGEAVLAVAQPRHAGMNTIDPEDSGQSTPAWTESKEAVSVETIDQIVARFRLDRLDLIKLDIEGSEVDALVGARQTISRFRPAILLEAEEARLASQGRSKEEVVQTLDELDYELWVFDAGSAQLRPAEMPGEPEGNAVAAPRGWRPPVLG